MSLTIRPFRALLNSLDSNSLSISGGVVTIQGQVAFNTADVEQCYKACKTACVDNVWSITPLVPTGPCECPWVWTLEIRKRPCLDTYETNDTFESSEGFYSYQDNSGATPTVSQIVTSVVEQINGNPFSRVIAAAVGTPGSYTSFTLTEKECGDVLPRTCGFTPFSNSATITQTTAHTDPILPSWKMNKEFSILPGMAFTEPDLARCGDYCVFYFKINPSAQVKDPHLHNVMVDRYIELEIYVDNTLANYAADWATDIAAEFACFA